MNRSKAGQKPNTNGTSNKIHNPKKAGKRKASALNESNPGPISDEARKAKKMRLKKELNKVASVDELNQLQANEKLYHSNFFHLQIEELLKEVKIKDKHQAFIDKWLPTLVDFILAIEPDAEKLDATELPWLKSKRVVPPHSDDAPWAKSQFFFQYLQPKSINPIGSVRASTAVAVNPVVDVCIEMPPESFQKTNHLNGVYHQKRALYLSYIALRLSEWDQVAECKFMFAAGDPLRPVLRVKPAGKYGKHITFDLQAICADESFKLERFTPDKSNVKQLLRNSGSGQQKGTDVVRNDAHAATPHYNASILRDLTTIFNDEFLSNSMENNANVKNAIVLLKVWLRQRALDAGYGHFSGYILTAFVVYLLQKNRINLSMNCYQIIRQVWIAFSKYSHALFGPLPRCKIFMGFLLFQRIHRGTRSAKVSRCMKVNFQPISRHCLTSTRTTMSFSSIRLVSTIFAVICHWTCTDAFAMKAKTL